MMDSQQSSPGSFCLPLPALGSQQSMRVLSKVHGKGGQKVVLFFANNFDIHSCKGSSKSTWKCMLPKKWKDFKNFFCNKIYLPFNSTFYELLELPLYFLSLSIFLLQALHVSAIRSYVGLCDWVLSLQILSLSIYFQGSFMSVSVLHFYLLLNCTPLYLCTRFYISFHQLMIVWNASIFGYHA